MKYGLILVLALTGCGATPTGVSTTDNRDVELATLFTHDGCTIYRFMDAGYYHYFSDCRNAVTTRHGCGKGCSREDAMEGQ